MKEYTGDNTLVNGSEGEMATGQSDDTPTLAEAKPARQGPTSGLFFQPPGTDRRGRIRWRLIGAIDAVSFNIGTGPGLAGSMSRTNTFWVGPRRRISGARSRVT